MQTMLLATVALWMHMTIVECAKREVVSGRGDHSLGLVSNDRIGDALGFSSGNRLEMLRSRVVPAAQNTTKVRFRQTYNGIPVYGTVFTAEQQAGKFTGVWSGEIVHDIESQNVKPNITVRQAIYALKKAFGHHTYRSANVSIKNDNGTLYMCLDKHSKARLSYLVSYLIEPKPDRAIAGLPARPHGIIDAHTGQLIDKWNGMVAFAGLSSNETGTSGSSSGTKPPPVVKPTSQTRGPIIATITGVGGNTGKFGRQQLRNIKVLRMPDGITCRFDTDTVQIQHMANKMTGNFVPFSFKCNDAMRDSFDLINGGYNSANDAAVYTEAVVAMFKTYTGHNGPIDKLPLRARVHYGSRYENAFWDGETMVIGDGATTFYPLVALDVIAHEYGHGYTSIRSRLQYAYQSGGMNEAFSDMAGEAAKFFATGKNDFMMGVSIKKDGAALRYMCNPTKDGRSIDSALKYNNYIDVHLSSGVYNKAFCILATSPGWTTRTAFTVFARANDLYWGAQSTFDYGACGVQHAAQDLGYNVTQVIASFAAVDVKCKL